jgi:drug/metabolite transporter (DMT)-like permease
VKGIFLVILASFLWALDTLIRYPLVGKGYAPVNIVFIEHALLTLIFLWVGFKNWKSVGELRVSHIFYFFIVGGIGSAVATVAFTRSFSFLNPSLVILLQKFQPVVAIILARIVLGEQIQKKFLLWALVCLTGALMIAHESIAFMLAESTATKDVLMHENAMYGYVFVLISIVGWGATTVYGKKLSTIGYSEVQIMSGRFYMGFLTLLPFFIFLPGPKLMEGFDFVKLGVMVLISGVAAMYFYYQGLKKISARACALAELFFPFCAVIVNWIFLDKTLTVMQVFGAGVLLLGSSVIQIKKY